MASIGVVPPHAPRTSPMVALVRELGAAYRISVARLRPAESDVRGRSSTWSKTFGAVRQVRGGAEAGFWVVCWVPRDGARQLAAADSAGRSVERGRGVVCRVSPWSGDVWRLFWPAHSPGAATDRPHVRMVVLVLVRRLGVWGALVSPVCGAGASRTHERNGGFRPRPDPHACHASGPRVCGD